MALFSNAIGNTISNYNPEKIGIAGFDAYVYITQDLKRTNTVVTNTVESGVTVADHVIAQPRVITINGTVADVFLRLESAQKIKSDDNYGIGVIKALTNFKTKAIQERISSYVENTKYSINAIVENTKGDNKLDILYAGGATKNTVSQQFVDKMNAIWQTKELITLDLGYETIDDLVLTEFTTTQDNEVVGIGFNLVFTEVYKIKTKFVNIPQKTNPARSVKGQVGQRKDKGAQKPEPKKPTGALYSIFAG